MVLKHDTGLVAPASGLFLRPQSPSQRWPCSRSCFTFPSFCPILFPPSEATMLAHRPVRRAACNARVGWQRGVVSVALGLLPDSSPVHTRQSSQST
ncbi:uncharacterized protein PgNI_07928 [Pyricularia grisea]|uniref:Uncharacterized protein n=1 Tax=Pyricularia grisea TaxID=148305 RepID=A0A6P8B2T0_PYRGI|nr:uncharacterized protein PgNI_07928 [Pyricularia grisea]TLD09013.1 hypothetical protein PgNI_07928 [Pyricularia grisea]